jgi:hypothetical protein
MQLGIQRNCGLPVGAKQQLLYRASARKILGSLEPDVLMNSWFDRTSASAES